MKFSEGRLSYLAHRVLSTLKSEGMAVVENNHLALTCIKDTLNKDQARDAQIDTIVRRKIASLSRKVHPESHEWEILYKQYYAEESRKRQKT